MRRLICAFLLAAGPATAQQPPLPAVTLGAGMHLIHAEVADRDASRAYGLMERTSLPPNGGMLFVFQERDLHCMWMKNTLLPLSDYVSLHVPLTAATRGLIDRRRIGLLKPGATLVYCVCSLEPEEAEDQIAALLARNERVARLPMTGQDVFGHAEFLTPEGDLRTLPPYLPDPDPRWGGLDGFYAARLTRTP